MENEILEIFYNKIIPEASFGKVEAFFIFNVGFNTIIEQKKVTNNNIQAPHTLVPTLIIKDKEKFDKLLLEYTVKATEFYGNVFYGTEYTKDMPSYGDEYLKSVIALLWSNATSEDFLNPCEYLHKRINFFDEHGLSDANFINETSIGKITYEIIKDEMFNETPYYIQFRINENPLPVVRYGISDGKAYIYAIQNITKLTRDKKLNRAMYKVNEGLDVKSEYTDNIEHPENLIGITPSTLISATLAISLFKRNGINHIEIVPYLPERWNAKEIAYYRSSKRKTNSEEYLTLQHNKHLEIQRNLTDKFLRTFRRIEYHFEGIEITSYPFITSENMIMEIGDNLKSNNPLLLELYNSLNKEYKM